MVAGEVTIDHRKKSTCSTGRERFNLQNQPFSPSRIINKPAKLSVNHKQLLITVQCVKLRGRNDLDREDPVMKQENHQRSDAVTTFVKPN